MANLEWVWDRLYEKREPRVPPHLADFADLEISSDELGGYIQRCYKTAMLSATSIRVEMTRPSTMSRPT
jgi:hypothetical protein